MLLKDKRVLITGASGFIGSHLTNYAFSAGADVTVLLRYNSIEHNVRIAHLWDNIRIFEADIRNIDALTPLTKEKFDFIFHLAAYNHVGNSFHHVGESMETNAIGSVNLLETLDDYQRLVYVSTSEVYGSQEPIAFQEDLYPRPLSPYSIGKYTGELYALSKAHDGLPVSVVRPFNAYGPYQSTRAVIPEIIIKCLRNLDIDATEGTQTREFNYVSDLVRGIVLVGTNPKSEASVINLGTGRDIAIRDLIEKIYEITGSSSQLNFGTLPTRPNEIMRMYCDNTKAREVLEWRPTVSLEDGLLETIRWFKEYIDVYHKKDSPLIALSESSRP